jgi:hypothetical protein
MESTEKNCVAGSLAQKKCRTVLVSLDEVVKESPEQIYLANSHVLPTLTTFGYSTAHRV